MTEDEAARLLCDERTVIARETAEPIERGDTVYVDFKGRIRRARSGESGFKTYYALHHAGVGRSVALFGTDWPR